MPRPLPRSMKGPKLKAFEGNIESIEFIKVLYSGDDERSSDDDEESSGHIAHSRVFMVRIEGKIYALKVFNFFSIDEIRPYTFGKDHLINDKIIRGQLDPFYAECRAFGLLVEKKKDEDLAVRCHGYVFLPDAIEREIETQFGIRDWNRKAEDEGCGLRAIVKDYIRWKSLRHRRTFESMRKKLEALNELGIYNMDIREANYLGGRLFDFSIAITFPHISLWPRLWSVERILEDIEDDLGCFDAMVEEEREREEKQRNSPMTRSQKHRALLQLE
ncbi:kinetochore Sim4 complex subunit FTA2-domain-containing protein [Xylaria venustula]|nr:kinetochore Sim4 complex subunit FTA2-domain-containing protein [Xylaria venustula]